MRSIVLVLLMLSPLFSFSQVAIEWQNTIGGNNDDKLFSIDKTTDGGIICGGYSTSNISGDKTENSRGGSDFWVVKLDTTGNIQWQKTIGGNQPDEIRSISQTADGGFICGGHSLSNISGDKTENSKGMYDYWIVKLDQAGNIDWQNTIGGNSDDYLRSITQTADGGFICAGYSDSDISGDKTENSEGFYDYWVLKLDQSGNIQWQNTIGGSDYDYLSMISQVADGGFICGGYSFSNVSGDKTENNQGVYDFWVVKLDTAGNILWQNTIGGNALDQLQTITQTTDGGYICGGSSNSNISGDKTQNCFGAFDCWIVKLDSSGNILWQNTIGGIHIDGFSSITQTTDGGYICGGTSVSDISGNKTENIQGNNDFWIIKLDASGNIIWQNNIGGDNNDALLAVTQTQDRDYVCAGWTSSNLSGDKTENSLGYDYWVLKLTDNFNLINGHLFGDLNSNNQYDTGEPSLKNLILGETSTGALGISGNNGNYNVAVFDTGGFSVLPVSSVNHYTAAPASHSAYFSSINQYDSLNDFSFQPNGVFNDLCLTITPTTAFRPGFNASYVISYENVGTTAINNTSVVFYPDTNLSFVLSNITPSNIFPDSIIWNIGTLTPFQTGSIVVTVSVNVGVPFGTVINSGAIIYPVAGDANPACNTHYWEIAVTGSFDPNDILVDRDTLYNYEFPNPPFLDYVIRFQNTGNDTAFTVKILNPIDTNKLQLNTFEFVAASHPVDMRFICHERNMEFMFENILLPDSSTNEPLSHGFVRYRMKPKSTLVVGDSIQNNAHIYFDFNDPVATNTAITKVELPVGISTTETGAFNITVYPNPSSGDINISFALKKDAMVELVLCNTMGQDVKSSSGNFSSGKNEINISTSGLPSGVYFIKVLVEGSQTAKKIVKI